MKESVSLFSVFCYQWKVLKFRNRLNIRITLFEWNGTWNMFGKLCRTSILNCDKSNGHGETRWLFFIGMRIGNETSFKPDHLLVWWALIKNLLEFGMAYFALVDFCQRIGSNPFIMYDLHNIFVKLNMDSWIIRYVNGYQLLCKRIIWKKHFVPSNYLHPFQ